MSNLFEKAFKRINKVQDDKGLKKYGKKLDPFDNYDWLNMASEELVDGFKYLESEKIKRQYVVNAIRDLTDDKRIHDLLNHLG